MNATTQSERIALRTGERRTTLSPWGFPIECVFEFYPGEPAIFWPTDAAHPGSPDNAQLLQAFVGGVDIYEMLDSEQIERIEAAFLAGQE